MRKPANENLMIGLGSGLGMLGGFFGSNPVVSVLLLIILISISIGAGYLISASRVDGPKLLNQEDEDIIQAELLD